MPISTERRKILVTAALPYANGPIHLGHMVEYLQADFWTRFQKLRGHECRYFCADDTHGTPIYIRAKKEGIEPEQLIKKSFQDHLRDFEGFGVEFDHFSSTHSKENQVLSNQFFTAMDRQGHIDEKSVAQTYCPVDNIFLPDRLVRGDCPSCHATNQYGDSCDSCGATYPPTDLKNAACSLCGNPPIEKESNHLFFKLENFRSFLSEWVPRHNSTEVTKKLEEWLDGELRDWDISRDAPYFGFEIPGHSGKYFYVWVDAPIGYISTSQQWCNKNGMDFMEFWGENSNCEIVHFIGKDIIYFHSLFWPAMLKAANFKQPDHVFVHGFLTINGRKMSKSKGTFIRAQTYLELLDPTYLRYYYGCKLSSDLDDIDLNLEDFSQRVNSDLVGKYINLGSRSAKILKTQFASTLAEVVDEEGLRLLVAARAAEQEIADHYENREFGKAMVEVRNLADRANRYFDEKAPWKLVKVDPDQAHQCLSASLCIFRVLSIYLAPIIPKISQQVAELFNQEAFKWSDINRELGGHKIGDFKHLLKRIDDKAVAKLVQQENDPADESDRLSLAGNLDIKDFDQVDLRVGKIIAAEIVEKSDKLVELKVDLGESRPRTIFSGIKKDFETKDLIGKKVPVVANLKPRKMKFGTSEGMILFAEAETGLCLIEAPASQQGSKIK